MDVIIQARLTSTRFPNKIEAVVGDKTILANVISRVKSCTNIDRIFVAVPDLEQYEKLKKYESCSNNIIVVYPKESIIENDVTGRILEICRDYTIRDFVRVCADSPILQSWVINFAVKFYEKIMPHYVVTVGMPDGMNAEIVDANALKEAYSEMNDEEKEHVTLYFENYPREFDCRQINLNRLSVDSPKDLLLVKELLENGV